MFNSTSYSRRQRNPHVQDESRKEPFFSQHDNNKSAKKNSFFQAKLAVNAPGDSYEKEADSVASAVVNKSAGKPVMQHNGISSVQRLATTPDEERLSSNDGRMDRDKEKPFQRKTDDPEKEKKIHKKGDPLKEKEEKKSTAVIQKKQDGAAGLASPGVSAQVQNRAGKGKPLPGKTMREMNASFGADFSQVHVHDDHESATMNDQLNAKAFTHGRDIYFNKGNFNPENAEGKFLLAHELTHVVQQNSAVQETPAVQRTIGDLRDLSSPRFKGDTDLEACFDAEIIIRKTSNNKGEFVRKIQQALIDAGFSLPQFGADGKFGDETSKAVKEFQKQSGLAASDQDGEVGHITMSRLDSRFTGASAKTVEKSCDSGTRTLTIDFVRMKGSTGSPAADIAFANQVFKDCCIEFAIGSEITMPDSLSDSLLGGDTDLDMAGCDAVSSEDLITFLTATSLFGLTNRVIAFYVDTVHDSGERERGVSVSGLCATGPRAPMQGMIVVANGAGSRTFPHELAHVLMNTFADHNVTTDNLQHTTNGNTGQKVAPVQCDIMYTRI